MCPKHLLQKLAHRNSASAFLMIAAFERKGKLGPLLRTCSLIQMLLWILKGGEMGLVRIPGKNAHNEAGSKQLGIVDCGDISAKGHYFREDSCVRQVFFSPAPM